MKRLLLVLLLIQSITTFAQTYNSSNSLVRRALVFYEQDGQGYFHKSENVSMDNVSGIINTYAYDKKAQELYLETNNANCVVTLNDEYAKIFKKSKSVPQLKGKDLENAIKKVSDNLEIRINKLNEKRRIFIQDSIAKAREDSIRQAREDSIKNEKKNKELSSYRQAHNWRLLPIDGRLQCEICEKGEYKDSIFAFALQNDTVFYMTIEENILGVSLHKIHVAKVPEDIKKHPKYIKHIEAYGDSLRKDTDYSLDFVKYINNQNLVEYVSELKKVAPYGFFNDWGWNNEYSSISFNFSYTNLNKKTIKYIDVYWRVTNDVNDVRKTGHFKGTGPLEELESASWDWDYSSYYVAGDASQMNITKVILTYTDGTQKVLSKDMLRFK